MRKGQEFFVDLASYMIFIFIVIIFLLLLNHQKEKLKENIAVGVPADYTRTRAIILMKTPMTYNKKTYTVAEMIAYGLYDNGRMNKVTSFVNKMLDEEYHEQWDVGIFYNEGGDNIEFSENMGHSASTQTSSQNQAKAFSQGAYNAYTSRPTANEKIVETYIEIPGLKGPIDVYFATWDK